MVAINQTAVGYGPDETCRLGTCSLEQSVYEYQPSLAANTTFLVLFAIALFIHIYQGIRWRTWGFLFAMFWGCLAEIIGYGGRIMLWQNPFSFDGFLIQICCLTVAPAFYSAAIYLTLSKIVIYLDRDCSRLSPKLYYWLFIPCDLVSLALQSAGGASSSNSSGTSQQGVDIAIAGLSFQVVSLTVFIACAVDYAVRFARRSPLANRKKLTTRFLVFLSFLSAAIVFILIRCAYRIDELNDGYSGPLIHNEAEFIGLEGVMVILAVFALNVAHPGPVFEEAQVVKEEMGGDVSDGPMAKV